jgi:signal transduction histidine kinase
VKPRLLAILVLLVIGPLGAMAYFALRAASGENAALEATFQRMVSSRLSDYDVVMQTILAGRERELITLADGTPVTPTALRALVGRTPFVSQAFAIRADGTLLSPPPSGPISQAERDFLARTQPLWDDWKSLFRSTEEQATASPPQGEALTKGWYRFYFDRGLNLIFWHRVDGGVVMGFELDRYRLIADIMEQLPADTAEPAGLPASRVMLLDATGDILHQWGTYDPNPGSKPTLRLSLSPPLQAWHLELHAPRAAMRGASAATATFTLVAALLAVGLVLGGLASYLYREGGRELREAQQRVSFVNQVSHELKTPLTNIRMYAELLEDSLPEEDEKARGHLGVVVQESQRLSRLIENVLAFARHQRGTLRLRLKLESPDQVIRTVLFSFSPALASKGVSCEHRAGAPRRVWIDPDATEQILNNLLGNVEKYATGGSLCEITSKEEPGRTVITVSDQGPGIPSRHAEDIFEPFVRLSTKTTDGVAGTGIGLSIARDLARAHGGDLSLLPSESGALFQLTLATAEESNESPDRRG